MTAGGTRHGWWPTKREIAIVLVAMLIGGLLGWLSRPQRSIQRGAAAGGVVAAAPSPQSPSAKSPSAARPSNAASASPEATLSRSLVTTLIERTPAPTAGTAPAVAAAQLGERADPIDPTRRARNVPARLNTAVLGVFGAEVVPVGVQADGQLEVPAVDQVGWYRFGAQPGEPGTVVLAAHVAFGGAAGVFARLDELAGGDRVLLESEAGIFSEWEVTSQALYAKSELPVQELFRTSGGSELILVTCGGAIDPELGNYGENVVVRARPVA